MSALPAVDSSTSVQSAGSSPGASTAPANSNSAVLLAAATAGGSEHKQSITAESFPGGEWGPSCACTLVMASSSCSWEVQTPAAGLWLLGMSLNPSWVFVPSTKHEDYLQSSPNHLMEMGCRLWDGQSIHHHFLSKAAEHPLCKMSRDRPATGAAVQLWGSSFLISCLSAACFDRG